MEATPFIELWLQAVPLALTALLILLTGWIVGRLISAIGWRLMHRLRFDEAAERSGLLRRLREADITRLPSQMIGDVLHWIVLLAAILVTLDLLQLEMVAVPLQALLGFLPRLLAAAVVLVAGFVLAQAVGGAARAALASLGIEVYEAVSRLLQALVILIAALVAFDQLGFDVGLLNTTFVGLIVAATAGLALTFALGAQGIAQGILAGHYLRENLQPGDQVRVRDWEGTLEAIGTLYAEFRVGEDRLLVPNGRLTGDEVILRGSAKTPAVGEAN